MAYPLLAKRSLSVIVRILRGRESGTTGVPVAEYPERTEKSAEILSPCALRFEIVAPRCEYTSRKCQVGGSMVYCLIRSACTAKHPHYTGRGFLAALRQEHR